MLEEIDLPKISTHIEDSKFVLDGAADDIKKALEDAFALLVDRYYNLSTKKQIDDRSSYNFYYDSQKDEFVSFPKKKAVGIAGIIFDKAARPTKGMIKWKDPKKHILPDEYKHLQERMEKYVKDNGLKITTAGLLLDGPNAVQPKLKIAIGEKKRGK